ncbi:MAG TPA: hypothetical protein VGE13_01995 [Candidatus Saccharimonadales bacterium]
MSFKLRAWLALIGAAVLALSLSVGFGGAASAGPGDQVCSGLDSGKIDTTGNPSSVTVTAPDGKLIDSYCVKAGSVNQGNGPVYVDVNPPQKTVTIAYPTGKAVSHYSVSYVDDVPPPVDVCPNLPGNQPEGTDCTPPEEPEGSNNSSSPSCETINIGMPTNVKPEGATVEVYLDDVKVTPGVPEPASAGTHIVKTYVNDVLVDTDEVLVESCDQPPLPDLVTVAAQESDDPCNPAGVTNNVTWKMALPDSTEKVTWTQSVDGLMRTATLNLLSLPNLVWADNGETAPKVSTLPADSGVKCDVDSTPTVTVTPTVTPSPSGSIGTPVVVTNTPSIKKTPAASPTFVPPSTGGGQWPPAEYDSSGSFTLSELLVAVGVVLGAALLLVAFAPVSLRHKATA